ncbi:MAG: MmgE/PrpD family protein [Propionibacteriaceae bacterium]|nr:MmgE/PrpD family protein [Propionibacteriaceae bacterium]
MTAAQPWLGATAELANFASNINRRDIPDDAAEVIGKLVVDTLGVIIAGRNEPVTRRLAETLDGLGMRGSAIVPGMRGRYDIASAALLCGTAGHALDFDDYCFAMSGHPSVVILPGLLALAARDGLTGTDIIAAYAVGFECAIAVSYAMNPAHYLHGWHGTGTVGTIGAVTAAANLVHLSPAETMRAISIAASSAGGLRQNFGTDVKPLHAGNAARNAVMAVELAKRGFSADTEILEGSLGFMQAFSPASEVITRPKLELGKPWKVIDPGITTKVYPSCGSTHSGIEAMLEMLSQGLFSAAEVSEIDVAVTKVAANNLRFDRPQTGLEGKFSIHYCLARLLVSGTLDMADFTDAAVQQLEIRPLLSKIQLRADSGLEGAYEWGQPRPSIVTVRLNSGVTHQVRNESPAGSPGSLPKARLVEKLRSCLQHGDWESPVAPLVAAIDSFETTPVAELLAMLAP